MQQQRTKQYARKTTSANPPRADDPDYDLEYDSSPSFIEEDSEPSAAFLASSVPTSSSAVPKPRTKQTARKSTGIWIPRRVDEQGRVFDVDEEADEHPGYFDKPMEDYSTNIKDDLKNVLQECKKSAGSFYSNCSYGNAPNPGLSVDGVGVIGLPLSEPEAKRLIKKCTQARFGKGERTILDKSVRDSWEVDAKKVNFLNPQWETWMRETALPSVCKEMNVSESEVDAELYKLLLYEKGSHFLAHQDTEKTTGMFATLVVVLPSKFDGGGVQLTHAGQTSVIDIASSSLLGTHVLSWYTDVFHAVLPIESGYRLALSYNVKQRLAGPKPRLLDQNEMSVGLNRVMKSWRQAADGVLPIQVPDKIIYTLEHEYSERDLRSMKLKGADEKLLNELIPIASELRFGLYIAHFELHQRGWAKETYESYNRSYDADEVSMQEVDEDQTCFTYIVDLSGREKRGVDLCIDDDTEVIPEPLGRGKPQKAEFGGFTGNEGGTLEYWYHKSVLILCPYHELFGVEVQEDYACRMLMKSNSTSPTKLEQTCVSRVLMACNCEGVTETEVREAIEALLRSALRWKDLDLWLLAANACPEEERLGRIKRHVLEACRQWPFKKLEGICESSLKHDGSNGLRLSLLDDLQNASIEWNDKYLSKWCDRQLGLVLSSLRAPKVDEIDSFIKVCMNKGVEFIKNILIPHFKEWDCDNAFWAAFLKSIKQHKDSIGSSNALDGIVSVLTSDIVSRSKVFPSLTHGWYREEFDMKAWEGLVELVLMSGDANVFKDLCKRMRSEYQSVGPADRDTIKRSVRATLTSMDRVLRETAGLQTGLTPYSDFFDFATGIFIKDVLPGSKSVIDDETIACAFGWCRDYASLKASIEAYATVIAASDLANAKLLAQRVDEERKNVLIRKVTEAQILGSALETLVSKIIGLANLETREQATYMHQLYWQQKNLPDEPIGLDIVNFCFSVETKDGLKQLLARILKPRSDVDIPRHMKNVVVPLLPKLKELAQQRAMSLQTDPFRSFFVNLVRTYIGEVLGPEPPALMTMAELNAIGCDCPHCHRLREFFADHHETISFQSVQKDRTHVEKHLKKTTKWETTWETLKLRSPHSLCVKKGAALLARRLWEMRQKEGTNLLKMIGDSTTLFQVLGGAEYGFAMFHLGNRITEDSIASTPIVAANATAGPSGTKRALPVESSQREGPAAKKKK